MKIDGLRRLKTKNLVIILLLSVPFVCFGQTKYFEISQNSDIYNAVLRELELNYVDSLPHKKMTETAINSMLKLLDPYTVFIPKSDKNALTMMTTGMYGGIGAIIMQKDGEIVIAEPHEGMPAQRSGLKAGDILVQINGVKLKGKSVSEASSKLRGIPGTEVRLKVKRPGEKKTFEKVVVREAIKIEPVSYYGTLSDSIGYISFREFTAKSANSFKNALSELIQQHHINKLIIDLRDNGGGLVNEAIEIASLFVPKRSLIVSLKGKIKEANKVYKTVSEPLYPEMPLLILVNEESASASEILAGALQDMDRAVIVGKRTFGKGLVQNVRMLPHESYLKVTTAKYYTPSGRCLQAINYTGDRKKTPDNLTSEFKTLHGRTVRDGGGITPDTTLTDDEKINISYYLFTKNIIFDYATQYAASHPTIATPDTFRLSNGEYQQFVDYVIDRDFTYQLESNKYLQDLRKMIRIEGYEASTDSILNQLTDLLKPDIQKDLQLFRKDITFMLESEIVKRYYFQKGEAEYRLRGDKWVKDALKIIKDRDKMTAILRP
ncbi:MAG: S41 family peptidase [Paludibacteraceae bacterium]|jgi:carboxyl-terminal processing protease|nr:S41 family peptidase [Paludibacteraceae bacterium]MDI9536270.1 S41 family peptidase [Bacteroidota bacterium]HHT61426.1 S41 family peptidase [Bacteroidales bacterium]MBP9038986.1 S41 family peptidase [Paludibacteraceae bacterium]HOA45971.1 S41 family peptidase [Paludibacteraceae bacterium]